MEVSDGFFIFFSLLFFNETFTNVSLHYFLYVLGSVLVLENGGFREIFNFFLFLNKNTNVFLLLDFFFFILSPSVYIFSILVILFFLFFVLDFDTWLVLKLQFLNFFFQFLFNIRSLTFIYSFRYRKPKVSSGLPFRR